MGFKSRVDGEVTKRPFGLLQIHPRDEAGSLFYKVLSQPLPERGRRHLVKSTVPHRVKRIGQGFDHLVLVQLRMSHYCRQSDNKKVQVRIVRLEKTQRRTGGAFFSPFNR